MSPGQTGFVPGTKWVCPRDKPRFSSYFTQRKPSLSLGQTQFVPGTFRERRAAGRVYVLKVYVPFSFPNCGSVGEPFSSGSIVSSFLDDSRLAVLNFRKTREGWNCRFQKTPRTEGGDEVPGVWTQGSRQVGLSR